MFQHAQSVVFIDANVSDVQHLVSGVLPDVAVKVLAADVDGIAQITNYLEAYPTSTVHLVSHGAPGVLHLGNTQLNLTNLENHAQALRSWFSPQISNPTLLLYGCNVAAGDAGEEFIEKLHQLTGAGIAASRQVIGQGYWSLEVSPTQTTALAPFSAPVLASWAGNLAPIINNLSNSSYSEQGPAYILDNDITFSGGTNYKGGYVEFSLSTATSSDFLTLTTDGSPATGNGQISIVGNAVYVGNGSAASVIGNVDSTFDGQNGQKLRINFSAGFENGNFNLGTAGSTTITGWTGVNQQVRFGIDTIAGSPTPTDTTFPVNNVDRGQNTPTNPGTFSTVLSSTQNDGSGNSVQLRSSGIQTRTGYDIVRGPSIYSNSTVQLSVGDQVSFEWQAQGGGDAYDVYGYLVDVNTGNIVTILNQTGNSDTASTTWATQTVNITQAGEYRFVFVAGTFDFTGGRAAGAQLFIDDVVVTQAVVPVNPNDSMLSVIAQRVKYNNTSDAPELSKTLTVSAKNNLGETASSTATITITPVNDPYTGGVTLSGTAEQGSLLTATSTLVDPDGLGTLNYQWQQSTDGMTWATIAGATASTFTPTQAQVGQFVRSQVSYTDGGGTLATVSSTVVKVNNMPTGGVTLSGTAGQGSLLTATSTLSDADGLGTLNYKWQQSTDGITWTTIAGATASTFTLTQAQVNQFVRSQVSYTDGDGRLETVNSNATATKIANVNDPPTGGVTLSGTAAQSSLLTATSTLGDVDGLGALNYKWEQSTDGMTWSTIAGATASTFTLTQAQVGQFVRSQVSYTDGGGNLETVNSNTTATKVANVNDAPTGSLVLSGTAAQNSQLTATSSVGDPDGLGALNYKWQQSADGINWTTIAGATASTFTLTQAQVNQFVRSQVSYTDGGGTLETVNSNATATKVANVNDAPMGGIAASGTAAQNAVLTVDTSALGDADGLGTLNYKWQQSTDGITWTTISGATASTFTLTQAQVGQFVRAQVSYTDGGGTLETVSSNATATTIANVNDSPGGLSVAKVYRTSIDSNVNNFEVYDPTTNVWSALNPITTSTQLAVSADNELYMLNNATNVIQRYNPDTDTWVNVQAGPNVNWGSGNLEVTNNNEFILTAQGQTTLYYTQGGTWNSLALPGQASTAADYDPITGKFVVSQNGQYVAWEVNLATATITTFNIDGQIGSGETRRFGEIYDGRYYSQGFEYPIYAYDLANNTLALEQVSPANNPVGRWLSAAVDAGEGLFYLNGYNSTNFSSWDPVTNTFVALAPALTASGHNTLAATSVGAPVTLSGAPQQNSVLTANTSNLVDLDGLGVLNYQWQQSSDGITWTAIAGATASTLTLTQERVGQFVRARVSYVDGFGAAEEVFSASTASKIANVNDLPTGGVTLTGTAEQGSLLTATSTLGDLDGLGTLNYQWQQSTDGITWATIAGATASTFTLTQAQVGQFVRSQVSFTDGGGTLETVNSNATVAKIANVNDAPTGGVTINGTVSQGQILTANTSTLGDADGLGTLNYQWQQSSDGNSWTAIAGATANTFTLTQGQVGQFVRSRVSYTDGGGTAESVLSNATATKVANVNDAPTGSVTINGTVAQGQILTANTSTLADADGLGTLSYQWKQSSDGITWSNIDGATGNTFSPRNAQVNQFLQVAVSYVDGQGTSESLTSASTSGGVVKFNATSDFNGDGSVDIFWRHQNVGESVFWLMDNINFSRGDFLSPAVTDVTWDIKALGDLNGDGQSDLIWQHKVSNQVAVWLMDGVNLMSSALVPTAGTAGWKVAASGDFNDDSKDDILWRNTNTGGLAVWFMDGTNLVSGELISVNPGLDWEVGAVGDFTKDGNVDIFWEHRTAGVNVFWEMDGTTLVKGYETTAAEASWKAKGAADFNQDGNLDLLWHHPGSGENVLWLMDGTKLDKGVVLPTTEVSWNPVV
ncbi:DUF4347 domain-containing protein [Nodosilinea sp. FACHB-131]|uniref:DUF4347 domain-containing protein n=1 Tax=Cyanophyceae TaxID=3028117 RepID=UPI00168964AA|nr:DUF4347 domain-containing protein [Nodosilinea sp. FACHB-131]MBD1874557.1 DUF4347 domain-containing protein [Nodosilinea sp. FACHB-131]